MQIALKPGSYATPTFPKPAQETASQKETESSDTFIGLVRDGFEFVGNGIKTLASETVKLVEHDPMLAFRAAATTLAESGPVLTGLSSGLKAAFATTMPVSVRAALMIGDGMQAYKTVKNPSATKLDKAVDIGAVVNDVVGLAGGITMLAASGPVAAAGATVLGAAYGVDLLAHAYRGLKHAKNRVDTIRIENKEA